MFIRLFLFCFGFVLCDNLSQPLSGIVQSNGSPVPFATIINHRTNTWSISDESGFFWIPEYSTNKDSLLIERIGFQSIKVVIDFIKPIELQLSPVELPSIPVVPTHSPNSKSSGLSQDRKEILTSIHGAVLRSYGGNAGIAQASIDGGRTVDVRILFNDINLTNPQNGLTDLSQLPNQFLGRATLEENPVVHFGSGTMDGIIKIDPWQRQPGIQYQLSQGGGRSISGQFVVENNIHSIHFIGGNNYDPGTHPILYNKEKISLTNNAFNQQFIGTQIQSKLKSWHWTLSSWFTKQDRGLNGLIWSPTIESERIDTLHLTSAKVVKLFSKGFLKLSTSHRSSGEMYKNPTLNITSLHESTATQYEIFGLYKISDFIESRGSIAIHSEQLKSTDAGNHSKNNWNISTSHNFTKNLWKVGFSTRIDKYPNKNPIYTYLIHGKKMLHNWINISGSFGTSFRSPTFNDMYWEPGGNPELEPEKSSFYGGRIQMESNSYKIGFRIKNTESTNLIVWVNHDGIWRPENVNKSKRNIRGLDWFIPLYSSFSLTGSFSLIDNIDTNTNTAIRYSPDSIGQLSIQYSLHKWNLSISLHYAGRQIIMYDYPEDVTLNPTVMSQFSLQTPSIFADSFQIGFSISNIFDQEIMTIYGYPEPHRQFQLNLNYQLPQKRVKK